MDTMPVSRFLSGEETICGPSPGPGCGCGCGCGCGSCCACSSCRSCRGWGFAGGLCRCSRRSASPSRDWPCCPGGLEGSGREILTSTRAIETGSGICGCRWGAARATGIENARGTAAGRHRNDGRSDLAAATSGHDRLPRRQQGWT